MAGNFEVSVERRSDQLYVDLAGDFDADSAHVLIDVLEKNHEDIKIAFVRTDKLEHVYPSGRIAWLKKVYLLDDFCYHLIFTGKDSNEIRPSWIQYF